MLSWIQLDYIGGLWTDFVRDRNKRRKGERGRGFSGEKLLSWARGESLQTS